MLKKFSLSWMSKDLLKFAWTIYIIITTVFIITAPLNIDFNFDRLLFPTSQIQILPFFLQNGFCQIFSGWLGIVSAVKGRISEDQRWCFFLFWPQFPTPGTQGGKGGNTWNWTTYRFWEALWAYQSSLGAYSNLG